MEPWGLGADELLAESQKFARVGSWQWDSATDRVIWSDELYRIFGLEPQTFPATLTGYLERVHPGDRVRVSTTIQRALVEAGSFDHEARIVRADGDVRVLRSRGQAILDNGQVVRMVGSCQDITEQSRLEEERERILAQERQARQETEAAHRLLVSILERVSDAFVSLDNNWRYTHVNEKAGKLLGRKPEELIGKHIWTEFPEGVGQSFYHAYRRAMQDQVPVSLETFYPPWNRWFENRIYPSKDGLSIFFQDVTERRLDQEALLESQDRFREIAENVAEAFWVFSPDMKTLLYLSPAFEEIFGIPASPLDKALEAWGSVLHPEDREKTLQAAFRSPELGPIEGTCRIIRPDGAIRWIHWRGFPVRAKTGEIIRITGFSQDVTDLKETEQALRDAQARLAQALVRSQDRVVQLEEQVRARATFERLVGKSAPMQEVYRKLRLAAQSDVTVLLTGESGTGKELAASAIHSLSERRDEPFVAVNCSAIPETLLESELFGHVKGAFTGAVRDKVGLFQAAEGGTLFLDEVGEMSPAVQVKVLRALQEREVRRVGDERACKVDVRIIAATNVEFHRLLAAGKLREDFYYRIRVFDIPMPPLRKRREDIPLLVRHFLAEFAERGHRSARSMGREALCVMMNYAWPGNVRELRNAIEHALVAASGGEITPDLLPSDLRRTASAAEVLTPDDYAERERVRAALHEAQWNRTRAAAALGTSRVTLWKKMRRFDLRPEAAGDVKGTFNTAPLNAPLYREDSQTAL